MPPLKRPRKRQYPNQQESLLPNFGMDRHSADNKQPSSAIKQREPMEPNSVAVSYICEKLIERGAFVFSNS